MLRYPLQNISKEQWGKKVTATYMYSIPAEDQALPILEELVQLLEQLHKKPITEVITEEHQEYFLTQVFPIVCQKILKSRYFKSPKVLALANRILELSVTLTVRCLDLAERFPAFAQTLITVFSTDEYYYKTNNQFSDYRSFAHGYVKETERGWADDLKEGDFVDVLKQTHLSGKASWSRGKVIGAKPTKLKVEYLNDYYEETISLDRNSYMLAPYKSRSASFDWRLSLKAGDLVDCQDHYGGWYGCTIQEVATSEEGKRLAKVAFKVYDPKGNKYDEKGHYFGLTAYHQDIDVTSPKIQPYGSVVKERGYYDTTSRGLLDNDDLNDSQFEELSGQRLYALPRKKCLSEFLFNAVNSFGRLGGFVLPLERLQATNNIVLLSIYVKGLSGVSQLLHKGLVKQVVERLKPIIERHIFTESQQFLKDFTKERSEMLFSGFKLLQRRSNIYFIQSTAWKQFTNIKTKRK